VLIKLLFYFLV